MEEENVILELKSLGQYKTPKPYRIAFIGWAKLSQQEKEGSGYNLVASELSSGLIRAGHKVFYLNSGRNYSMFPKMYIQRIKDWHDIECYTVFNSPNLSPGCENFGNLKQEIYNYPLTKLIIQWLKKIEAEIVHIHSQEGFSLDLIPAIRQTGLPVVVTPHDYWYVCPQVNLLYQNTQICMDYEGGTKCETCMKAQNSLIVRLKNTIKQNLGDFAQTTIQKAYKKIKRISFYDDNYYLSLPAPINHESELGFSTDESEIQDGLIKYKWSIDLSTDNNELSKKISSYKLNQNNIFLDKKNHCLSLNQYGKRRSAGIEALKSASLVTPPSNFLRDVYVVMGLQAKQTQIIKLGLPHLDQIHRRVKISPYYKNKPWEANSSNRPLRFGFLGTTVNTKGLLVLIQAITKLSVKVRQKCHFVIRVSGETAKYRQLLSHYPEVSFLSRYRIFELSSIVNEYDVGILPHIWFENSPIVLLEHLHAGKFVISSSLGGVFDWIMPPKNGLLFEAGNSDSLTECISKIVKGEISLPSPYEVHQTVKLQSYPEYLREMELTYCQLLEKNYKNG